MSEPPGAKPRLQGDAARVPLPVAPRIRHIDGSPRFSWSEVQPGGRYLFRLEREDEGGRRTEVLREIVQGDGWRWPPDREPLPPGRYVYCLEDVSAGIGAPVEERRSPEMPFEVLGEEERREVFRRITTVLRTLPLDGPVRHILLGCLYESDGIGLLDDARRQFVHALSLAPDDPALRALLASVEWRIEAASGVALPEARAR